ARGTLASFGLTIGGPRPKLPNRSGPAYPVSHHKIHPP
ncbi:MAG: hypothetical protein RL077_2717, partial [Verrucomicrobiota bacterium]